MGLWGSIEGILFGVNPDEEKARGAKSDADLRAQNALALQRGKITEEEYVLREQRIDAGVIADPQAEINQAFKEGWSDGYKKTTGAIASTIQAPFQFAWDATPKKLLLIAIVGGAVYALWKLGWLKKWLSA